jgi:hypothetical protein
MGGLLRRSIKFAMIGDGVGPVSAEELVATPTMEWELWRRMITDARQSKPPRHIARCMKCGGPVFIQTKVFDGRKWPLFAHYAEAGAACPWHTGRTMDPDDVKAAQYQGTQESEAHRQLCELVGELASADPRTIQVTVDSYLPPTANNYGRYPDVLVRWAGRPAMAIELQLSRTFQTEISARCLHYDREGMPLVWILYGVDLDHGDLSQSFRDVLSRHRMNAFLLDRAAIDASRTERTLVLSYRLARADGTFEPAGRVRLDALIFPPRGLPFVEDRLTPSLMEPVNALRRPWFAALAGRDPTKTGTHVDTSHPDWNTPFRSLFERLPELERWAASDSGNKSHFAGLVAIAFSIVTHAQRKFVNYATAQENAVAMLNSRLSSQTIAPFANLIRLLLLRSNARELLDRSVGAHLERAVRNAEGSLYMEGDPPWAAIALLLPELFDDRLRAELMSIGAMPAWASAPDPDQSLMA